MAHKFLESNNIEISKVTYSYKLPSKIIDKYHDKEIYRGQRNGARREFIESLYNRLLNIHDKNLILKPNDKDRCYFMIEFKVLIKQKYYNITINTERITFHNIDYEYENEIERIIFNLVDLDPAEMGRYKFHNTTYKIDFGSCHINSMIKNFGDIKIRDNFINKINSCKKQLEINEYAFIHNKRRWIDVYYSDNRVKIQNQFKR